MFAGALQQNRPVGLLGGKSGTPHSMEVNEA